MKNHLLVTVSSHSVSSQYRIHKVVVGLLVLGLVALFASLAWNRMQLIEAREIESVNSLAYAQSQKTIQQLGTVQTSLTSSLEQSQEQLKVLDSRLVEIETLAGTEGESDDLDLMQRAQRASLAIYEKQLLLSKIPNGHPLDYWRVSSKFGVRTHPITKRRHSHVGMDLRANKGTPIFATADGYVEKARTKYDRGYGNMIILRHQMGFSTRYAHLDEVLVKYGQYVRKGELIARCGNSGDSTASHLHYEVRFLDKALDPKPFIDLELATYDQVSQEVRTVPWESFHREIRLLSQLPEQPLLQQGHASRVPLNSAATFMSMAK